LREFEEAYKYLKAVKELVLDGFVTMSLVPLLSHDALSLAELWPLQHFNSHSMLPLTALYLSQYYEDQLPSQLASPAYKLPHGVCLR
jgi:hypothetical protein